MTAPASNKAMPLAASMCMMSSGRMPTMLKPGSTFEWKGDVDEKTPVRLENSTRCPGAMVASCAIWRSTTAALRSHQSRPPCAGRCLRFPGVARKSVRTLYAAWPVDLSKSHSRQSLCALELVLSKPNRPCAFRGASCDPILTPNRMVSTARTAPPNFFRIRRRLISDWVCVPAPSLARS